MHFYEKKILWLIGFALVYCVGVNERENQISGEKMFQSNIYHDASIKGVLCISGKDVPIKVINFIKQIKILVHAQDSCACTTLLCMHWRGQGPRPGPKKSAGPGHVDKQTLVLAQ